MPDKGDFEEKPLPKRLRKPKVGKNYAIRPGGGFHRPDKRPQNGLLKRIEEEIDLYQEERRANGK